MIRKANRIELRDEGAFQGYARALSIVGTNLAATVSADVGTITWSGREVLTGARTYYVRTDGSDSNTGLVDNAGGAFLTMQKAISVVQGLDLSTFDVVIQVRAGTYTSSVTIARPFVGTGTVSIVGDTTTPSNVTINVTSATAFVVRDGASIRMRGLKIRSTTAGHAIIALRNAAVVLDGLMEFGEVNGFYHMYADRQSSFSVTSNYTVSGGAGRHWSAEFNGVISAAALTITLTGTPAFGAFAVATAGAALQVSGNTFSGSATGQRFSANNNAAISVNGAGLTYLPGNAAGSTTPDGEYF